MSKRRTGLCCKNLTEKLGRHKKSNAFLSTWKDCPLKGFQVTGRREAFSFLLCHYFVIQPFKLVWTPCPALIFSVASSCISHLLGHNSKSRQGCLGQAWSAMVCSKSSSSNRTSYCKQHTSSMAEDLGAGLVEPELRMSVWVKHC